MSEFLRRAARHRAHGKARFKGSIQVERKNSPNVSITLKLTANDKQMIRLAAASERIYMSEFLRRAAHDRLRGIPRVAPLVTRADVAGVHP